jgi:hypothetical protein
LGLRGGGKGYGENLGMSFVTLCSSQNGTQFFKPRRVSQGMRHVWGDNGDTYSVLEGKTERKTNLENIGLDWIVILK